MAGTKAGGKQAAQTNKDRYGADWYQKIGKQGGSAHKHTPSGFAAMPRHKVVAAGRKGGSLSSRKGIKGGAGRSRSARYMQRKQELTAYELHTGGEA